MCTDWISNDLRAEIFPIETFAQEGTGPNRQVEKAFDALAAADPVFVGCEYSPH
jgi:hypothetical protein